MVSGRWMLAITVLAATRLGAQSAGAQSGVPEGFRPPPGMCRIWIEGVPAERQPAPTDCATAVRKRPSNAHVVFGDLSGDNDPVKPGSASMVPPAAPPAPGVQPAQPTPAQTVPPPAKRQAPPEPKADPRPPAHAAHPPQIPAMTGHPANRAPSVSPGGAKNTPPVAKPPSGNQRQRGH